MSTIPPDIYEHVREMAVNLASAYIAKDAVLKASLYQRLVAYHEEQLAAGRSHPFLIKTLADFTQEPAQAVRYYEQALALSRQMASDEPTHTILISLGAELIEMGRREQAEAYIRDGRAEAVRRGAPDSIDYADCLFPEGEA